MPLGCDDHDIGRDDGGAALTPLLNELAEQQA